ncbi:PREDICTED: general transcription factor 3C polypeptide 5-like [Lepidothrix coronata]|uniref:General transcription factor 3C polypeptide 5-like n=1 Tax=Lepidothrix coronata TaxID=321398 RepID=A0A6J0G6M8_9PASS|nr:PREDICTED: general transcription factor 3C polypeptide 5-like [Lepidothrix coronata]
MAVSHSLPHLKPTPECRRLMSPSLLLLFSLQKIIHRNDGTESECTERDGWCLPKTSDDLRDSMSLMIKQIIRSTRPALFSNTTSSEDCKEQLAYESGEDEEDEEEEEEDFKPSDGSENEMETEILDYV